MEKDLERRIAELEKWKTERQNQQITFPLDNQSITILNKYFMALSEAVVSEGGVGGNVFVTYIGSQGPIKFNVGANIFFPYTVNVSTNVFTVNVPSVAFNFSNNQPLYVATSNNGTLGSPAAGVPPAPLDTLTEYYVISASSNTFKLSATVGGAEIDITDTGTGNQYFYYF